MIELALIAAAVALGFLIVMYKMGIKKVLAYDLYVDVGLTILLMMIFSGSFSGMVVALIGGLALSIILLILRKFIGYTKYEMWFDENERQREGWVNYPGWFN